jgi:hypothetical protein
MIRRVTETSGPGEQPPQPAQPQVPQFGPQVPQFGTAPPGYPNGPHGAPQYPQYGPYGGQYGYPVGYYAPSAGTNGMAIASLILGICGFFCITPFLGIGFGIAALSRIGKTGQSGKGMAIAGIILSGLWILLLVLVLATGGFHIAIGSSNPPSVGPTQGPNQTSA